MIKCLSFIFIFCFIIICSQEKSEESKHQIELSLTHVNISSGYNSDGGKWISLPGFGLDYDYEFSEKWSLGLHTDIIIEKFVVEKNIGKNQAIERSYPIAPALMASRKFGKHLLMFGAGAEFAKEENLFLNRLGYKYELEISEKWSVGASFNYDFRWNNYDSYTLGIGIGRKF